MLLAHAGGVDEAAVIVLPLLIFAGFLLAERRVRRREREGAELEQTRPVPEESA